MSLNCSQSALELSLLLCCCCWFCCCGCGEHCRPLSVSLWQGSATSSSTAKQPDKLSPVSGPGQTVQIEIDAKVGVPQ